MKSRLKRRGTATRLQFEMRVHSVHIVADHLCQERPRLGLVWSRPEKKQKSVTTFVVPATCGGQHLLRFSPKDDPLVLLATMYYDSKAGKFASKSSQLQLHALSPEDRPVELDAQHVFDLEKYSHFIHSSTIKSTADLPTETSSDATFELLSSSGVAMARVQVTMSCRPAESQQRRDQRFSLLKEIRALDMEQRQSRFAEKQEKEAEQEMQQRDMFNAIRSGDVFSLQRCLDTTGADVNSVDSKTHMTALQLAIRHTHTEVVRLLLETEKCDLDAVGADGLTALHIAVQQLQNKGGMDVLRLLLEQPLVDINCADYHGITPLMTAVAQDSLEAVQLLVAHDPPPNVRQVDRINGDSALVMAEEGGYDDIARVLRRVDKERSGTKSRRGRSQSSSAVPTPTRSRSMSHSSSSRSRRAHSPRAQPLPSVKESSSEWVTRTDLKKATVSLVAQADLVPLIESFESSLQSSCQELSTRIDKLQRHRPDDAGSATPTTTTTKGDSTRLTALEKENKELRERVQRLERFVEAVMGAGRDCVS